MLVLGTSYTKRTLFFSLFWIQGSIEAKRINVSCSCIETKALWLAHFRPTLGGEGELCLQALLVPGNEVKGTVSTGVFPSPPL